MALTRSRFRMTAGAMPTPIDYNEAASDGTTDARSAIVSAMASGSCYFPKGIYRIASNLTITSTVHMAPGAVLMPAAGVTVTLTGEIVAGAWQIFELGLGGVVNGAVRNQMILPEWWGAVPNVAVNQSAKIQAALNFAGGNLRTVYLRNGMWRCDQTLTMTLPCGIVGDPGVPNLGVDANSSVLDFSAAPSSSHGLVVQRGGGQYMDGVMLRDIVIYRNTAPTPGASASHGLIVMAASYSNFENVVIWNFDFSFGVGGYASIPCVQCRFVGCRSRYAGTWHWNIWSAIDCVWDQCPCELGSASIGLHIYELAPATLPNALHFRDCLIILPDALDGMRIAAGFWHTITGCVFEEQNNNGIVVNLTAQDLSLINVMVHDCWFNGTGVCFNSEGMGGNFRITNNRMEVQDTSKPAVIYIDSPSGGATERDIVITGNIIKISGAAATGMMLSRVAGAMIHHNRIWMHTAGAAQPGITFLPNTTQNIADINRIKTTHSSGILDLGIGNALINNYKY